MRRVGGELPPRMALPGACGLRRCQGGAAMTCPDPETLTRYQAGTLPAEEAEAVREHLNDCPTCAALAAVPPAPAPLYEPAAGTAAFQSASATPATNLARSPLAGAIPP